MSATPKEQAKPSAEEAERALERLAEMSADLRGAAILDSGGAVLAATGEKDEWEAAANGVLEAADEATGEAVERVEVGTGEGEAYAVRAHGLACVAVTERFTLASLVVFDMRSILRELAEGA